VRRDLTEEFILALSKLEALDHLDVYGGALFALEIDEAFEMLEANGWEFNKQEA
jgi:hypothetical protein